MELSIEGIVCSGGLNWCESPEVVRAAVFCPCDLLLRPLSPSVFEGGSCGSWSHEDNLVCVSSAEPAPQQTSWLHPCSLTINCLHSPRSLGEGFGERMLPKLPEGSMKMRLFTTVQYCEKSEEFICDFDMRTLLHLAF